MLLILLGMFVFAGALVAGFFGILVASDEAWEARPWFIGAMVGAVVAWSLVAAGIGRILRARGRKGPGS